MVAWHFFRYGLSSWSLSVSSLAVSMSVSMSPMDAEESAHRGGNTIASRHQVSNTLQDNTADHKAGNEPASSQQRIQAPFAAHGRTLPMVQSRWPWTVMLCDALTSVTLVALPCCCLHLLQHLYSIAVSSIWYIVCNISWTCTSCYYVFTCT